MKGMTSRDKDLEDVFLMAKSWLNYDLIFEECKNQSQNDPTGAIWESFLNEQCIGLETKYGVTVPFRKKLEKISTEKMLIKNLIGALEETALSKTQILGKLPGLKSRDIEAGLKIMHASGMIVLLKAGKYKLR